MSPVLSPSTNGHATNGKPSSLAARLRHSRAVSSRKADVMQTAALSYFDHDLPILPAVPRSKKPLYQDWQHKRLSREESITAFKGTQRNIVLVLNLSPWIDVECDSADAESALLKLFDGEIPPTPTWKSKRGLHRLFRRPPGLPQKAVLHIDGIEFRGVSQDVGAASVVPPSIHPSGIPYEWLPGLGFDDVDPAELPPNVIELLASADDKPAAIRDAIANGTRNQMLFRLGCAMRSHGTTQETIERALLLENSQRCDPPLPDAEIRQIAKSVVAYDPGCGDAEARERPNNLIDLISLRGPGEAAYHGFVGDFVRALEPYTEATPAGLLAHLLPAIGTLIGPGPHVSGGDDQPARLNTALVGPTSRGRKGTAFVPIRKLIARVDSEFSDEQVVSGLSSGEGLIQKVSDRRNEDQSGKPQGELVDKRLLVVEPEFSKVLLHSRREGNILSQVLRETFDSGNLGVLTRKPLSANGAHISIVGHITPEELRARFSDLDMANGFGNRFLWFYSQSDRLLPDAPPIPMKLIVKFAKRLAAVVRLARTQKRIERDEQAAELWRNVYPFLCMDQPGLQGAMLARGPAIVLRVALIYALLDESPAIRPPHLEAALAIWQYNAESVRALFANKVGDLLQDRLLELLGKGALTKTEIFKHVAKPRQEIDAALNFLKSIGRAREVEVKRLTGGGRPAKRWELVEQAQRVQP